jgi:hypothetical protein
MTIGIDCATYPDCRPIPNNVSALAQLLRALNTQQLAGGTCAP